MSEDPPDLLEQRARQLFADSVAGLDMPTRSRLTQARYAALAARPAMRLFGVPARQVAALGSCAALVLGLALFVALPATERLPGAVAAQNGFEDLEIVAANEEGPGDTLEMLQDDADFYDWAAEHGGNPDATDVG